jgi:hypothetical protein
MLFAYFILAVALLIETVGAYYSITGLAAIFSGAVVPILIMGGSLELGKVTAAVWLKNNWDRAGITYKIYLVPAVAMLMLITSMGIFGYLSKAHNDQTLVSGDVGAKLAIYDEKIRTARDNIEAARKQLAQMDAAVDQVIARSTTEAGADKANAIRNSQKRDRAVLARDIEANQRIIAQVNDEAAPIRAENRKVEAEVGPIKYIAKLIYGDNPDANILEKAVTWVIMIIVAVFDPLALVLILAAQQSIRWAQGKDNEKEQEETAESWFDRAKKQARFWDQQAKPDDEIDKTKEFYVSDVEDTEPVVDQHTHIPPEDYYRAMGLFDTNTSLSDPYISDSYVKNPPAPEPELAVLDETEIDFAEWQPEAKIQKDPHPPGWMWAVASHPESPLIQKLPIDEHDDGITLAEKEAKRAWKMAHPDETIKKHRLLYDAGHTDNLPWNHPDYHPDYQEQLGLVADNVPQSGEVKGFGTQFPVDPTKGDMFLRVDRLPSVLYKFNGNIWIEVDKALSDQHAYDRAYIDHLIEKIDSGEYDPDLLSEAERASIEQRLGGV